MVDWFCQVFVVLSSSVVSFLRFLAQLMFTFCHTLVAFIICDMNMCREWLKFM